MDLYGQLGENLSQLQGLDGSLDIDGGDIAVGEAIPCPYGGTLTIQLSVTTSAQQPTPDRIEASLSLNAGSLEFQSCSFADGIVLNGTIGLDSSEGKIDFVRDGEAFEFIATSGLDATGKVQVISPQKTTTCEFAIRQVSKASGRWTSTDFTLSGDVISSFKGGLCGNTIDQNLAITL